MQNQKRLSKNTAIHMVFLATVVDITQILLDSIIIGVIVNRLIDIIFFLFLYVWFKRKGVSFTKLRAMIFFGLGFVEFFPVVDAFPLWIIDVVAVIITVNMEDRLGINAESIISNPRLNKILKKGIMRGVNVVANRNTLLKGALDKSRGPQQASQRNIDNTPMPNNSRDAKIKEQQANKRITNDQKTENYMNHTSNANDKPKN